MRRLTTLLLVCACALVPIAAHADDGGWLDWLYHQDPKFVGFGTEWHGLCLGKVDHKDNQKMPCEEYYGIRKIFGLAPNQVKFEDIQHEFNLRFAYYHTYGDLYEANPNPSANTIKLMGVYRYRPDNHISVGLGAGWMPFFGDDLKSKRQSAILMPVSVTYAPARNGNIWWKSFFVQIEASFITNPLTPAVFTTTNAASVPGEWNISFGSGFDFRRRCLNQDACR
jgi:hypothetical protein